MQESITFEISYIVLISGWKCDFFISKYSYQMCGGTTKDHVFGRRLFQKGKIQMANNYNNLLEGSE